MKKYSKLIGNEIQRQFTYRVAILSYAFGNIAELVSLTIIWSVVYRNVQIIRGYSAREMITYAVFAWFFSFLTTTYAYERVIAKDIQLGTLANLLVKPISYLRYSAVVASGRIVIAFVIVWMQAAIVFIFFQDRLILSGDLKKIALLVLMLVASYFINLFLSILVGFIAFWTTEIDGAYYFIKTLSKFLSGFYFPIALMPSFLASISLVFPFAYTIYIPVQLYLGKITFAEGLRGFAIELLWLVILYIIIKIMWRLGLRKYESVGI